MIYVALLKLMLIFHPVEAWSKTLILGLHGSGDRYPFQYKEKGQVKGMLPDIFLNLSEKLRHKIIVKYFDWDDLISSLKNGDIDVTVELFERSDRAEFLHYVSEPIALESVSFFYLNNIDPKPGPRLLDYRYFKVGLNKWYRYQYQFDKASFINKRVYKNEDSIINALLFKKEIEVGVGNKYIILSKLKKINAQKQVSFSKAILTLEGLYIAFSRQTKMAAELARQYTKALVLFKKSKEYHKILRKYGQQY